MSKRFEYKYSVPTESERKEIEHIQSQYLQKNDTTTKIERLRKLDNKVKNMPAMISIALGIVGLLIFGLGLTMILEWDLIVWGAILSTIGCIPMGLAYLAYNKIYNKLKNQYSPEILKLSRELLNEETKEL